MTDKSILQLPLATSPTGALLYGVQDNMDKAFSPTVLLGTEQAQAANFVYAGPVAPPGAVPSFRRLVVNDIPDLSALYMRTTGGALVSPIISNPTITGGNISGSTIVVDDDKFRVRNATDTTKVIRFSAANITPGQTRIYSWPDLTGDVVTHNATQDLVNKSLFLRSSTAPLATFRIPHGVPPSDPVDGDMWTTAGGLYVRISGVTVGPLAAEQTSYVTSFNTRVGAITLLPADVVSALGFTPYDPSLNTYVRRAGDTISGALSSTSTITATDFIDGTGSLRAGINASNNLANTKVAKAGDRMTGLLGHYYGAVNSQQVMQDYGYSDANRRWAVVIENAAYTLWSYNTTGGNPTKRFAIDNSSGEAFLYNNMNFFGNVLQIRFRSPSGNRGYDIFANISDAVSDGIHMRNAVTNEVLCIFRETSASFGGTVYANGGFQNTSDPRTKDKSTFRPLNSALDKLSNLNVHYGKYHDWANGDGKERVFLMADNAMKQGLPQVVSTGAVKIDDKEYDSWDVAQMIAVLVKATQELHQEVNDLKEKINELTR